MFFDDAYGLVRVAVVGTLTYASLLGLLRISGKRTLAKMNAFDLVVTVALGSTLATALLTETVSYLEGLFGLAILIALQYGIAYVCVRSDRARGWIKSQPRCLLREGSLLPEALRQERITEGEVFAALRQAGMRSPCDADAVVLETDGSLSVLPRGEGEATVLQGIA